ncbi:ecdysone 20-monooxygenase isoform X2 [Halyomorpha halys]|uniref:ecdysone 20-monooxygenase isoform X2 n=1 Tax=Halyomorpha halys TaxID=286706 RepID=UPI0006D4CE85|nr:ecdysone 20-monooxygenase isoform X2 [Halyomorpha halys]
MSLFTTMQPPLEWNIPNLAALFLFVIVLLVKELKPILKIGKTKYFTKPISPKRKILTVKDIPGPQQFPVIGTRWIYYTKYTLEKIHEAHKDLCRTFGPIVKEEALWNIPVINIFGKNEIEKVLRQPSKYPLRPPTEVTAHYRASRPDRYPSLGLINEQGETWHSLRSHLTPELTSAKTMSSFFPELLSVTEDFIRLLQVSKHANGIVEHFDDLACRMGLESTCCLILGKRLGVLEDEANEVSLRLANAVKEQFCASRDTYFGLPFWKLYPTEAYKRFVKAEEIIYDVISEMVENAENQENDSYLEDSPSVFLSILNNPGLDIREKKAGIIDFIAAGIKTLGNTLVFLLYLMAKNPECQEKLVEEIHSLTSGKELTLQALGKANYLKACITESYRMLPTAPCLARILETDMELNGFHLPSGSVVLCHTWQASLMEENFSDANQFIPERWLGKEKMPWLVAPFGAGRRLCPGKRFVELELQVLLAQIVRKFKIECAGELEIQFEFLMAPSSPTNLKFVERT